MRSIFNLFIAFILIVLFSCITETLATLPYPDNYFQTEYHDGLTHDVYSDITPIGVDVGYTDVGTTVNVYGTTPGADMLVLAACGISTVNMLDGYHEVEIETRENSVLNHIGGFTAVLSSYDSSQIYFQGGSSSIQSHNNSGVTITGGSLSSVSAWDQSAISFYDGSVTYEIVTDYGGHIDIFGGNIGGKLRGDRLGIITIYGQSFNYALGEITEPSGTLSGILSDGSSFEMPFNLYNDAKIILVPEPATLALLGLGGLMLRKRKRI